MNQRMLILPRDARARLRSIEEGDLEDLRQWKNRERDRFFFQGVLTPEDQVRWYAGFRGRADDFMFMAEDPRGPEAFGCIGFRLIEDVVDVYNVIRGRELPGAGARMGDALALLCSHALSFGRDVTCKVLRDNPAVAWYERQLFVRVEERPDHYLLRLDTRRFVPVPHTVEVQP